MSQANLDENTERRIIAIRRELHDIGFPGDLMNDELLAGSLVLVRKDGWWEVVPGWTMIEIVQDTEWMEVVSTYEPRQMVEAPRCTVRMVGPPPAVETWPPGPIHIFAFDLHRFFLGYLDGADLLQIRPVPGSRGGLVEITMISIGHCMIDTWDNGPA